MQSISPTTTPLTEGPVLQTRASIAYITSLREIESEGVGGLISKINDTLSHLQSYRLNGNVPAVEDSAAQHRYHRLGQTYEITLIVADDDLISPTIAMRLAASGLATYNFPSSNWRNIKNSPEQKAMAKAQFEWNAFQSKRLVHDFDLILSDSYRNLFGPTTLNGFLFHAPFNPEMGPSVGLANFQNMLAQFNIGVSPKIDVTLSLADIPALSEPGSQIERNGFTIRHETEKDQNGRVLHRLGLYTLPMEGLVLNIHPAYTKDLPGYTPTSDAIFRHGLFRRIHSSDNFIERDGERCYRIPLRYGSLFHIPSVKTVHGVQVPVPLPAQVKDLLFELEEQRIFIDSESKTRLLQAVDSGASINLTIHARKEGQTREYRINGSANGLQVFEHEPERARALFVVQDLLIEFQGQHIFIDPQGKKDFLKAVASGGQIDVVIQAERETTNHTRETCEYRISGPANGPLQVFEHGSAATSVLDCSGKPAFTSTLVEQDAQGQWWLVTQVNGGRRGRFTAKTGATLHYVDAGIDTGEIINFARSTSIRNSHSYSVASMDETPPRPTVTGLNPRRRDGSVRDRDATFRDGEQQLRESNYTTKNAVLENGLMVVLRRQSMQERIQADRESRQNVRNANPLLARLNNQAQKQAIHAPSLV